MTSAVSWVGRQEYHQPDEAQEKNLTGKQRSVYPKTPPFISPGAAASFSSGAATINAVELAHEDQRFDSRARNHALRETAKHYPPTTCTHSDEDRDDR